MKAKVTDQGVTVPRRLLGTAEEVEIREEEGRIVLIPLAQEDAILGLGLDPISTGTGDGSTAHDRYLYGADE